MQPRYKMLFLLLIILIALGSTVLSVQAELFVADPSALQSTSASCLIYAVDQKGDSAAQLFAIDLRSKSIQVLGSLAGHDLEGVAVHPKTHVLYATASEHGIPPSDLFTVDTQTGALLLIGNTGFGDVADLAFRATDATLWGWVENEGLIQIDLTTGIGTRKFAASQKLDGIAWNNDGTLLYGAAGKKLWVYEPNAGTLQQIADNLPKETTSLEMRPDGLLLGGANEENSVDIFTYDSANLRVTMLTSINDSQYDPDDIAWPAACGNASPGGQADMIREVIVNKQSVCPNEELFVSVRAEHPENSSNTVDIAINEKWGAAQHLHFGGEPGPRLIQVTALTPEKYADSRQITVTVTACEGIIPVVTTQPNPYHDQTVDFHIANAPVLQLQNPVYLWNFGDGQSATTTVPFVSHFYGDSLNRDQLYTVFQANLVIQQGGQPDLLVNTTLSVWNMYAFNKKLGFIQPRITSSGKVEVAGSLFTVDYKVKNLESQPVQFTSRWMEYQFCDVEQSPIFTPAETISLQIEGQQELSQHFEVPVEGLSKSVCNLAIHLAGATIDGVKAYASAYFEVKSNSATTLSINDPASLATLNHIIKQGWLGGVDVITDEDLYRLRREGKIVRGTADLVTAASTQADYLASSSQIEVIGQLCQRGDSASRIGISCQVTNEWTYTPAYIVNAKKGDTILDPGCNGIIGELLRNVSPPQKYSHSGIMTKDRYEIRHATAGQSRYKDYTGTDGVSANVLKYGWPGTITQQIYQAFEGEYLTDPENGKIYLISGFTKESPECGELGSIAPQVVKPRPEFEASARPKLHEVADIAQRINGHYRFFVYSNGAISFDPAYVAPAEAGWAVGTVPVVCSDFIWYAMKLAGLTLEGNELEINDYNAGAERDEATLDGLYKYTAEERLKAGGVLYSLIYNLVYDVAGWFGTLLTDAPDDAANQVVNCFASDWCNQAAKDSDRWKQTEVGRSVSPDNILFWDASSSGGYGHNEPLIYQPGRYKRVYRWLPSPGTGTVTAHVYYEGNPVKDALVMFEGFTSLTDANGEATFVAIPAGVYEIQAAKLVDPSHVATVVQDVTVTEETTNFVDLFLSFDLPPQPTVTVIVTIERLYAYGCLGEDWWIFGSCRNPETGLEYYTITRIDENVLNTRDQFVEGDPNPEFFPQWDLRRQVNPSRGNIPIEIEIWEADSGDRGSDDDVDIYPQAGRTLKMMLNLTTCQLTGSMTGSCGSTLYSEGGGDGERNLSKIWFRVDRVTSQNDKELTTVASLTPAGGGKLITFNDGLIAHFPANAVDRPATAIYKRLQFPSHDLGQRRSALHSFTLAAQGDNENSVVQLSQPYTVTLNYTAEEIEIASIAESSLHLVFWDGNTWVDALPCTGCGLNTATNQIVAITDQLTEFALVGDVFEKKQKIYLPLVGRP